MIRRTGAFLSERTIAATICLLMLNVFFYAGAANAQDKASLKQLGEKLYSAVSANDVAAAITINKSLISDDAALAKALSPQAAAEASPKITAMYAKFTGTEQQLATLIRVNPGQSVVTIYEATTEEIAQGAAEFPGGAVDLAKAKVLRAGMTFYEMTFTEPGKDKGMKYHLFFWDGQDWKMLGPVWRAIGK